MPGYRVSCLTAFPQYWQNITNTIYPFLSFFLSFLQLQDHTHHLQIAVLFNFSYNMLRNTTIYKPCLPNPFSPQDESLVKEE